MVDKLKIEQCVESLCQNGCATVRATITAMEHDIANVPLTGLELTEQQHVLNELKVIMSVYDNDDSE
ncbi:MAG: hypothetical protein GXP13_00295 [Gammaproteobacteria bacterium]|nr:hypothetical protein [Gammaproteobacteria bacterium]